MISSKVTLGMNNFCLWAYLSLITEHLSKACECEGAMPRFLYIRFLCCGLGIHTCNKLEGAM